MIAGRFVAAHRYAWAIYRGEIPEGMCVLHHCDVPLCCNPEHLFIGTHADNMADCAKKGRNKPPVCPPHSKARGDASPTRKYPGLLAGEKNGRSKVSDAQRIEIRRDRLAGEARWVLARRYGLSESQIGNICRGISVVTRKWKPESRARASARMTGRKMSASSVAKTAAANRGLKRSELTRARLREAWARRKNTTTERVPSA